MARPIATATGAGALAVLFAFYVAVNHFRHAAPLPPAQPDYQAMAREAVGDRMIDPQSVLFTHLVVGTNPGGGAAVCGWVNGRNRFGAYAGARRFIWWEKTNASMIESDVNSEMLTGVWSEDGCT